MCCLNKTSDVIQGSDLSSTSRSSRKNRTASTKHLWFLVFTQLHWHMGTWMTTLFKYHWTLVFHHFIKTQGFLFLLSFLVTISKYGLHVFWSLLLSSLKGSGYLFSKAIIIRASNILFQLSPPHIPITCHSPLFWFALEI